MVTTIIPTYNRPSLLIDRAIASIYAQTVADWSLVVVGDGTDARTVAAMTDLAAKDARVRFWNIPRPRYPRNESARWRVAGLDAINFGLAQVTGGWVSILADDDEYLPHHHAALRRASQDVDVVYGQSIYAARAQIYGDHWPPEPLDIAQGSYIIRRSVVPAITRADCKVEAWDGRWWRQIIASGARFRRITSVVHNFYPSHAW